MSLLTTYYTLRLAMKAISFVACAIIAIVVYKRHARKTIKGKYREVNEYNGNAVHLLTEPNEGLPANPDEVFHRSPSREC